MFSFAIFISSTCETLSYRTAAKEVLSPGAIMIDPEDGLSKGTFLGQEVKFLTADS